MQERDHIYIHIGASYNLINLRLKGEYELERVSTLLIYHRTLKARRVSSFVFIKIVTPVQNITFCCPIKWK